MPFFTPIIHLTWKWKISAGNILFWRFPSIPLIRYNTLIRYYGLCLNHPISIIFFIFFCEDAKHLYFFSSCQILEFVVRTKIFPLQSLCKWVAPFFLTTLWVMNSSEYIKRAISVLRCWTIWHNVVGYNQDNTSNFPFTGCFLPLRPPIAVDSEKFAACTLRRDSCPLTCSCLSVGDRVISFDTDLT